MASIAQGLIQGLATGFGGESLATDLLQKQVELKKGQQQLKASEYQTAADKIWSKAIMDVLAGSKQTQLTPPTAPQPGQASVPGVQPGQAAAPPATPTAPGLGGPSPASATLQTLGAPPQAPAAPPPIADPMNAASILAKIKADNPNLDPGVLSSVVNDHLLPYLNQQQQNDYKHFQQVMEYDKFKAGEQDKADMLFFHYQQLQEQMANAGANRDLKMMLAQQSNAIRQELVAMHQPLVDAQIALLQARRAQALQAKGAIARLPPGMQATLTSLERLQTSLTQRRDAAANTGDDAAMTTFDGQLQEVEKKIQDLTDKAEQLDAQGAPQQPVPAKGSGDPSKAGQSEATVPADTPPKGLTAEEWKTYTPAQKKIMRDFEEGKITQEQASAQLAKTQ